MSDEKKENKAAKNKSTHIPLRIIKNESEELAEEMQNIFDEDKVTHKYGTSEPERD
ncbi:MAG: hypothetical protein ACE5FY_06350 [Nitrospiria bacterium]